MANHMAEVAKMLGVELGERFTIIDLDGEIMGTAIIDECGFKLIEYNVNYTNSWYQYALEDLLTGKYIIKRKPWKPKDEQTYWHVDENGYVWQELADYGYAGYLNYYKLGNCYRTREEAEANRDKWIKFYASDEVLEV